jgi:hypothetical protein
MICDIGLMVGASQKAKERGKHLLLTNQLLVDTQKEKQRIS